MEWLIFTMVQFAIAEHVMKDWSCERLALVMSAYSLIIARIVGPRLGWMVDEDAVVKSGLNLQSHR